MVIHRWDSPIASLAVRGLESRRWTEGVDRRICQTFAASPAEPGNSLVGLACLSDRCDVALALLRGRRCAERRPLLHQPAPLLEHVAAAIGLLHLAPDDMRQRRLDDLAREARALARPVVNVARKPCAVRSSALHAPQQHQERHVGERPAALAAGETQSRHPPIAVGLHLFEDGERASGQWNAVLPTGFHAPGRNGPSLVQQVDLAPPRNYRLARSGGREDRKFERAGCNALLLAQRDQEARQLAVGQCGVVLDLAHLAARRQQLVEMAAPARRVFAGADSRAPSPNRARLRCARANGPRSRASPSRSVPAL